MQSLLTRNQKVRIIDGIHSDVHQHSHLSFASNAIPTGVASIEIITSKDSALPTGSDIKLDSRQTAMLNGANMASGTTLMGVTLLNSQSPAMKLVGMAFLFGSIGATIGSAIPGIGTLAGFGIGALAGLAGYGIYLGFKYLKAKYDNFHQQQPPQPETLKREDSDDSVELKELKKIVNAPVIPMPVSEKNLSSSQSYGVMNQFMKDNKITVVPVPDNKESLAEKEKQSDQSCV